jgi:hypothetical protein
MDDGDDDDRGFPLSAYSCIPLHTSLWCINQSNALVASDDYILIITNNIRVIRMVRRLQKNT